MSTSMRKKSECERLANRIQQTGIEMLPCDRCQKKSLKCVQSIASRYCSECKRVDANCSAAPPSALEWDNLQKEEDRLSAEKEVTLSNLLRLSTEKEVILLKLLRLEHQQKSIKTKGAEMLRRGLASLDELEAVEELERQSASQKANSALSEFSDSFWDQVAQDVSGGTSVPLLLQ